MPYDVSEHPRLGAKGKQLFAKNEEQFEDEQALAVERLNLGASTTYTAAQLKSINRAIALQINWQLEVPISARYIKQESSSQSHNNITYRDGIPLVSPEAIGALPLDVQAGLWGDITSVRRAVR